MAFKQTITYSGTDMILDTDGRPGVVLYATASGTGDITAVLCDDLGMLLTSGVN